MHALRSKRRGQLFIGGEGGALHLDVLTVAVGHMHGLDPLLPVLGQGGLRVDQDEIVDGSRVAAQILLQRDAPRGDLARGFRADIADVQGLIAAPGVILSALWIAQDEAVVGKTAVDSFILCLIRSVRKKEIQCQRGRMLALVRGNAVGVGHAGILITAAQLHRNTILSQRALQREKGLAGRALQKNRLPQTVGRGDQIERFRPTLRQCGPLVHQHQIVSLSRQHGAFMRYGTAGLRRVRAANRPCDRLCHGGSTARPGTLAHLESKRIDVTRGTDPITGQKSRFLCAGVPHQRNAVTLQQLRAAAQMRRHSRLVRIEHGRAHNLHADRLVLGRVESTFRVDFGQILRQPDGNAEILKAVIHPVGGVHPQTEDQNDDQRAEHAKPCQKGQKFPPAFSCCALSHDMIPRCDRTAYNQIINQL